MIIAITGCIGSGKSYLLATIAKHYSFKTYSSDEFVQQAYQDLQIIQKLDEQFHCIENGVVNKEIIKRQLDEKSIQRLNQIIHPYVFRRIQQIKDENVNEIIFIEVPLLFETKMNEIFDYTIAISVPDSLRHQKLYLRNTKQYENMLKLEKYQFSNEAKKAKADFVIESEFDMDKNLKQIEQIIQKIRK